MNKKIKGSELIKKIENNDLEMIGRKIKFTSTLVLETKVVEVIKEDTGLYLRDIKTKEMLSTGWLINSEIEILEDNTEEIEELTYFCIGNAKSTDQTKMIDKINELVRIVNSIRKNIDKEYCCCCGVEITDENRAMNDMCNECKYGIDWKEKE